MKLLLKKNLAETIHNVKSEVEAAANGTHDEIIGRMKKQIDGYF